GISSVRVGNTNEKGVFYLDISEPVRLGVSSIPAGKRTINIKHSYLERKEFLIDPEAAGARFSGDTLLLDTLTVRFQAGVGEFVEIEGGTFRMGSEDSLDNEFRSAMPIHEVSLSTYRLQKYEVTVGQYMYYVQEGGGRVPEWIEKGNEYNIFGQNEDQHYTRIGNSLYTLDHPVTGISWEDAMAYASWWSDRTGRRYGLPTEAQWEFAARGGNLSQGYVYAGSNELTEVGWYANNSGSRTHQVGQKKANELGLYDMSGNVWEWCADWYDTYPSSLQTDPTGPDNGDYRVVRGGSWYFDPNLARVSNRRYIIPLIRSSIVGFRLCRY
ncbi:MAG: formylglycine-generating enzyme family protein, partial [Bacteroidota bacterium]